MMNALRGKIQDLRSQSTSRPDGSGDTPILDDDTLQGIQKILDAGGTHLASISVRAGTKERWTQHQVKTMMKTGESADPDRPVVPEGDEILPIASITKIMVAVAVLLAIEGQQSESIRPGAYAKFRGLGKEPLSKLYNLVPGKNMGALPGNPTFEDFVVHRKGLPSVNHRLLSPTGQPMVMLSQLLDEILSPISRNRQTTSTIGDKFELGYSNTNYAAIAMIIEALWDGTFEDFMDTTLFGPLEMTSTSIGFPANTTLESYGWVVDSNSKGHRIARPKYRPDGAEAAALGAYSTARDVDIFFEFISKVLWGKSDKEWVGREFAFNLFKLENNDTGYCPLGLFTNLHSSGIGSMSINRRQFPDAQFSTYPVLPTRRKKGLHTCYMAGTALGCSCATAFNPIGFVHSVVVLTDTSGPVDTADHILRLILRRLVYLRGKGELARNFTEPESVLREVEKAMTQTMDDWRKIELEDTKLIDKALAVDKNIAGVYKGDEFSQWLEIKQKDDSDITITVRGPSHDPAFDELKLIWINENRVKICVRPHLAVDTLRKCDWADKVFEVVGQDRYVGELIRRTALGEDRYLRHT